MGQIKLIALDLDGTLLTSGRQLSPGAADAVALAVSQGVRVCLASGRALSTMIPFATDLNLTGPFVSCNGAYVVGADGLEVRHHTLPESTVSKVADYALRTGVHTNVYSGGKVYFSGDGEWASVYRYRTGIKESGQIDPSSFCGMPATKILFIDHREAILGHHDAMSELLASHEAEIALSEAEYIEFLPPGVNKATGLQEVASALSLQREQVAAVGDYLNDLEMVRWAGFSGSVANGAAEVREQADVVVTSNDEGGAAEFILAALER